MKKNTAAAIWVETGYEENSFQSHSQILQIATLKHAMYVVCKSSKHPLSWPSPHSNSSFMISSGSADPVAGCLCTSLAGTTPLLMNSHMRCNVISAVVFLVFNPFLVRLCLSVYQSS